MLYHSVCLQTLLSLSLSIIFSACYSAASVHIVTVADVCLYCSLYTLIYTLALLALYVIVLAL